MKQYLCTIYDKVAEKANDPFLARNEATAVRTVTQMLANSKPLQLMAHDLELRIVGHFDDVTAVVSQIPVGHRHFPLVDMLNNAEIPASDPSEVDGK